MDENNVKARSKKKKTLVIVVVLVLFATVGALGAVCIHLYQKSNAGQEEETTLKNAAVSGSSIVVSDDKRDVAGEIKQKTADGKIVVKMTQSWVFEDGCKTSNAYLANSERNSYDLRFEISLADTGEVLMTSPDVPVGSCIENFGLEKTLDPGDYDVVVAHQQIKDGEIYNTVRTSITITVK